MSMTTIEIKLTNRWKTITTGAFNGSVARDENPSAHGCVCHYQARKDSRDKLWGRMVNSNGRFTEEGERFELDEKTLKRWQDLATLE